MNSGNLLLSTFSFFPFKLFCSSVYELKRSSVISSQYLQPNRMHTMSESVSGMPFYNSLTTWNVMHCIVLYLSVLLVHFLYTSFYFLPLNFQNEIVFFVWDDVFYGWILLTLWWKHKSLWNLSGLLFFPN